MKQDFIKEFWENQAIKHGQSPEASWGDNFAIDLEVNNIGKYISDGDSILDVGCANGFALLRHAKDKDLKFSKGVDFSSNMIEMANAALFKAEHSNLDFSVGDVRALSFDDDQFDIVYTTRVLINLPNWEEQMQGIQECLRVTKPGGTVILSEAFWEPLIKLNALRSLFGLDSLVEHDFNRYIKKVKLNKFLTSSNMQFEINDFSSVYYLGSRFIRELVTEVDKYPGYSNPINEIFYNLEKDYSGGDVGVQQAYIIKKN
jgi:ubiquinone/menaquinone biosynthesis C-methylase UbiE